MRVFVTGCFDLLHSGHIRFLEEASSYGELIVGIASDENVRLLKREPVCSEQERLYMVSSLKSVKEAFINKGTGDMDFTDFKDFDILFVNADGYSQEKGIWCKQNGKKLISGNRIPKEGLPARSTTRLI